MVGNILDLVYELNIEEDTIIFFSGDNGPADHDIDFF